MRGFPGAVGNSAHLGPTRPDLITLMKLTRSPLGNRDFYLEHEALVLFTRISSPCLRAFVPYSQRFPSQKRDLCLFLPVSL